MEKQILFAIKSLEKKVVDLYSKVKKVNSGPLAGDLQGVTDLGNTTTNDVQLLDGAKILFDNGSRIQKGTTNGLNGGNGGVSQVCSIDYELKWEAGRQYVLQQDGFTIREVRNNFTIIPSNYDDATKGFVVDSRWVLDNGDVYVCTDNTEENAVWELRNVVALNQEFDPLFRDESDTLEGVTTRASYTMLSPKICFFRVHVNFAECTNFGTLGYSITLPFPSAQTMRQANGTLHQPALSAQYHIAGITDTDTANASTLTLYYSGSTTDLAWKSTTPVGGTTITSHFDISGIYQIE